MKTLWLRTIAVGIAILAAIDPAVTSNRSTRPEIAVVTVDRLRDSALAIRVARALGDFNVTPAPLASAEATVLVGDRLPEESGNGTMPQFAVSSDRNPGTVEIASVDAPSAVPLDAQVAIGVTTRVSGARGHKVEVMLHEGGVIVDRAERAVTADDQRIAVPLTFTPSATGAVPLRVTAKIAGGDSANAAAADLAIDVRDRRWAVLFYDPRASWMSTFVRRALEADDRFVVSSRVVTSRNISTDAGSPPSSLDDLAGVARYDAVIVGAPDALTDRDVAGLDALLRRRGASVVMLLDQHADGAYQRLTGGMPWRDNGAGRVGEIAGLTTPLLLRASELAWPGHLPDGAVVIANSAPAKGDSASRVPVIWRLPVGAGRLIVSGALDAWRYRDAAQSGFDPFWRELIADAANAAPPPVEVSVVPSIGSPDRVVDVRVTVRDAALQPLPSHSTVSAMLQSADGATGEAIRLWPDGAPGAFRGTFRAPATPGSYRVAVTADGNRADGAFIVAPRVASVTGDERELLAAWTRAHGGRAITAERLGDLPGAIRAAIHGAPRLTRWHPMRSAWWLLPFALCLCGEWWLRRRGGMR